VVALGRYRGDLSSAIVHTKLKHKEPLTLALARLLFDRRREAIVQLRADMVAPLPMHWLRRWRRGVNGPDLLAEVLAAKLRVPMKFRLLKRARLTTPQTDCSPSERRSNQRQSFRLRRGARIQGQRILLVDDVLTTGATTNEAAKILLKSGAQSVFVAAIARGIGDDL
jgi:ComF family protein